MARDLLIGKHKTGYTNLLLAASRKRGRPLSGETKYLDKSTRLQRGRPLSRTAASEASLGKVISFGCSIRSK